MKVHAGEVMCLLATTAPASRLIKTLSACISRPRRDLIDGSR
jgi:hypothetical protein